VAGLTDQLELLVSVIPRLTDQVRLDVQVFHDRVADPVLLEVDVTPKVADSVLLLANVVNQDFEAGAQAKVLAPTAEVTFL
jgi:hypothetical protein